MSKKLLSLGRKQISKFNSWLDNMDLKQKQGDKDEEHYIKQKFG